MTLNIISDDFVSSEEENNLSVIDEIGVSSYHKTQQKALKPKDAMNVFHGCLVYMSKDFDETPDEFREYV